MSLTPDPSSWCPTISRTSTPLAMALSRGSLRILSKRELFDVPVLAALRALGMVVVDRLTPDRATIHDDSARNLAEGGALLVFPEGTTSRRGGLLPFRAGALEVAVASQVPIVPACFFDTRTVWPASDSSSARGPSTW